MSQTEPPDQPKTTELPAVPQWAAELTVLVKRVSSNVDTVISAVDVLRDRVNAHDLRFAENDARATNVSERVRGASQVDLEHSSQLAQEKAAREALAEEIKALTESQAKQSRAMGIGMQGLQWLASKDGANTMMRIATMLGAAYAALKAGGVIK